MARTRGGSQNRVPGRDNFPRGPLPKSVRTQADAYRNDRASAFGKIRGVRGSMGGRS